jgi:hypothetical protein
MYKTKRVHPLLKLVAWRDNICYSALFVKTQFCKGWQVFFSTVAQSSANYTAEKSDDNF